MVAPDAKKSRSQIQREIKQKEAAIEYLARRYRSRELPEEELKQCMPPTPTEASGTAWRRGGHLSP